MLLSLENQCALVTGANRGIGQAIALQLAKQGAWVAGTATTIKGAQSILHQFSALGLQGEGLVLDVANTASIEQLVTQLSTLDKLPSILVNNAGITCDSLAVRTTLEDWDKVLNVNLKGAFYLIKSCLPAMIRARYGRIINISSVVGLLGNPGQASYAASKAGLIGLSQTLSMELAPRGITVNTIAPGLVKTDMTNRLSDTQRRTWLQQVPVGRFGHPDDIAYACVFLASKEANYITGHTLHINGGLSTR